MPYRTGGPAPQRFCAVCHATLAVDGNGPAPSGALCDGCARGRRRARLVSYAFLGVAGVAISRVRAAERAADARRAAEEAAEERELERVRGLVAVGEVREAVTAVRAAVKRFGVSGEWASLEQQARAKLESMDRAALEKTREARRGGLGGAAPAYETRHATPQPTLPARPLR